MEQALLPGHPANGGFPKRLIRRSRVLLCAALGLGVLLPAFALGSESEAPVDLAVNAQLGACAPVEAQWICSIDVSFDTVPGATSYTASVRGPDGSVIDHATVGAGSARVWFPYVGNGTYLVDVSAYGEPDGKKRELLGREGATGRG